MGTVEVYDVRQAEIELWESLADRRRLEVEGVVHTAALSGLQAQRARDGDGAGGHAAEVCEQELITRRGLRSVDH
jgi:hypothetical protein